MMALSLLQLQGQVLHQLMLAIANAELRIMKELDLTAFRKTVTIASGTAVTGVALPQDLVVLRFLRIQNGDMLYLKDENIHT